MTGGPLSDQSEPVSMSTHIVAEMVPLHPETCWIHSSLPLLSVIMKFSSDRNFKDLSPLDSMNKFILSLHLLLFSSLCATCLPVVNLFAILLSLCYLFFLLQKLITIWDMFGKFLILHQRSPILTELKWGAGCPLEVIGPQPTFFRLREKKNWISWKAGLTDRLLLIKRPH